MKNKKMVKIVVKYLSGAAMWIAGTCLLMESMHDLGVEKAVMAISDCLDDILTEEENKDITNRLEEYAEKESQK